MPDNSPYAYLITIRTYNSWCHGDLRGSIDPKNNQFGARKIPAMEGLRKHMATIAKEDAFFLDAAKREAVLLSVKGTANYNRWKLLAVHVRTNHFHVVIRANCMPEKVMGKIKCYATKALKKFDIRLALRERFWARHGSTVYVWAPEQLFPVLYYVVKGQGAEMALFYDERYYDVRDEMYYEAYFLEE